MLRRLRVKFVCINMLLVTVMLAVIFGLILHSTARNLEEASIRMMQSAAAEPMPPKRPGEPPQLVRLPCFTVRISPRGGLTVLGGGSYGLSDEAFLRELVDAALAAEEPVGVLPDYGLRFCRSAGPGGQSVTFADLSSERDTMGSLARNCAIVGGAAFLIFLLISLLLARWAVRPVESAWTQQRQFVADASHELKTPLTVILTNAELLQDPAYPEEDRARFSGSILTMARQMRGLVESLLELARVDAGMVPADCRPLDLSELVSDAVLPFEPLYFERELELESQVEGGISVKGSAARLRQMADVLLDNAMKYSAPRSAVTVRLTRQGGRCLLAVSGRGRPIPPEELTRIFRRFYRGDSARSMDGSYGLGLSIAKGIAEEHRGKIWAESEDGWNTFFVELPVIK